ncbi:MAG: oligoribonuclease [Bdellovibrionales bacterium]
MEKLLWIDMEMTGLDVEREVVIEVAAVVTDMTLQPLDQYHSVVKQPAKYLDGMDDWNQKHHRESGLIDLIPSGKAPNVVESDLLGILDQHFANERAVLAGNSIGQDRLFINKHFGQFASRLHYRMLDVTSYKIMFVNRFNIAYEKKNTHRAVDDINESIAELNHYLSHIRA